MERRAVLKIVALTALSHRLNALPGAAMSHMQAVPTVPHTLQFFSEEESVLLDQLMEMIIPADDHSPGAHEAQTNLFADLMVATSDNAVKKQWQDGIRLMREQAIAHRCLTLCTKPRLMRRIRQPIWNGSSYC